MASLNEPFDEACRLVGKLMNAYAQLELALTEGIHRVYKLKWAEGNILTASMPFGNKSPCLSAAIKHYHGGRMTAKWAKEADAIFSRLEEKIRNRNFVAHTYFEPSGDGGVSFFKSGTRKGYSQSIEDRTSEFIDADFEEITDLAHAVQQLVSEATWTREGNPPSRVPNGKLDPLTPLFREEN